MPTIRKRGEKFHVQVRMAGFPARTATFRTRRQADRWAKTIEADMIEGKHFRSVEARRRTVADAIDRYMAEELPKKRAGDMHRHNLPWWRRQIGHLRLADVSPAILVEQRGKLEHETYIRARPDSPRTSVKRGEQPQRYRRSPTTVNRYLAVLSHVFTVARKEWHWVSHNPFEQVGKLREAAGRVRVLSEKERAALLAETVKLPQLHVLVVLALSTAARAGELLAMTWRDVDLADGRMVLRNTKNADPRSVPLYGEALRLLQEHGNVEHAEDDRVFQSAKGTRFNYHDQFKAACVAAGVQNFRFHDLRHSAATYLARDGASEQQLRAIGGWKSQVVNRYVHMAAEDTRVALQKLSEKIVGK